MADDSSTSKSLLSTFGVGCFHFGYAETGPVKGFDLKGYVDDVRKFLAAYPDIKAIQIAPLTSISADQALCEFDHSRDITCGTGIAPWPQDWQIDFTLHLSDKLQYEIGGAWWRRYDQPPATKFKVSIRYIFDFPVAIVKGLDGYLETPSDGVFIVRKYLEQFEPEEHSINFQNIGPSPFHADFFIFATDRESFELVNQPGNSDVTFTIKDELEKKYKDIECEKIENEVSKELGIFYVLMQSQNRHREHWFKFVDNTQSILSKLDERPPWYRRFWHAFSAPKFDDLSIQLAHHEMRLEETVRKVRKRRAALSIDEGLNRFDGFFEKEIESLTENPTEKFGRIISVIQEHGKIIAGHRTVLISAFIGILVFILGGLAGGLTALIVKT